MFRTKKPLFVQINGSSLWRVARDPETNLWIAVCDELNANALGETWEELQHAIAESIALLFADLLATGELAAFLQRNHWTSNGPLPEKDAKNVRWDLPFETKLTTARDLVPA